MRTLKEFTENPDPKGETVEAEQEITWICLWGGGTVTLDGEFTAEELGWIIKAINEAKTSPKWDGECRSNLSSDS